MARYNGIRPHVQAASRARGVASHMIERNRSIGDLNHMLCQVTTYLDRGRGKEARALLDAARKHLAELDVAHTAGHAAFEEVEGNFADRGIPLVEPVVGDVPATVDPIVPTITDPPQVGSGEVPPGSPSDPPPPPPDNPIKWNPGNKVVQDHRDGTIDHDETNRLRALLGLPVPWTPEIGETEVGQPDVEAPEVAPDGPPHDPPTEPPTLVELQTPSGQASGPGPKRRR